MPAICSIQKRHLETHFGIFQYSSWLLLQHLVTCTIQLQCTHLRRCFDQCWMVCVDLAVQHCRRLAAVQLNGVLFKVVPFWTHGSPFESAARNESSATTVRMPLQHLPFEESLMCTLWTALKFAFAYTYMPQAHLLSARFRIFLLLPQFSRISTCPLDRPPHFVLVTTGDLRRNCVGNENMTLAV